MVKTYLIKTLLSFISLKASLYITHDNWMKLSPKKNGFIKRNIFALCMCLIPVFRWIWVAFSLIIGIALGNDEFCEKVKENTKD